jgi:Phage tail tube protein
MPYVLGESVNLGVGGESGAARGTPVNPTDWIPARTPTGIRVVIEKTLIRESRSSGVMSSASEITQKRAEGDLEFNLRSETIGWILRSLFGFSASVAKSAPNASVYDHTFSVLLNNPQHPSLTLALRQPNVQDYEYPLAVVNSLEIRTPVNDLVNATAGFIAKGENEHAAYTQSFANSDAYFRNQDIVIKIASTVAGLDAASPLSLKEFSLSINNNARPNQVIGSNNPNDVLALLMEITGSFKLDYLAKTYHDYFVNGTYFAMRIELTRADITLGSSANPKLVIDLPKVSVEGYEPDRPLDDIVMDGVNFTAHYDTTSAKAITAVLTNTKQTYTVS